ncbi:PREDICTED: putative DBH-like monooxygenase protein 2 isoform X2 [Calidris pugnax]|uniref:putative DBH-like monooxygenase protein 2 isoform X2 n=1 Tax=Calidris pugnax TaxID=198806 RepID=UPI00071D57F9|nr:PREDICTED: putative DBH-like monooxygenase protein 2 isoform X2 [Calidris pugnax]
MLFLLFLPCFCSGQPALPPLRFSVFLDPSNMAYLCWDHDEREMMSFELQVRTTSWVAFGFSPHGELPRSENVTGGVFPNGSIYFSDYHVVDEETLEEDDSQDYQLLSVTENETSTTVLFKRHLQTRDPNDLDITVDTACLVTAFGPDDTVQFFKGQRFSKSLFLMRYRAPSDSTGPKTFFTYDLRLDNSYQFPDEAAISIGTPWDPQYIRLEIHYSNFDLLPDEWDAGSRSACFRLLASHPPVWQRSESCSIRGGPSTMNEMCLAFLFYYPRNNISSCMGYPDILYIAHVLKQEASDAVEAVMAIDFVDWDNETVKIAETAAKETEQVVMIKTINETIRHDGALLSWTWLNTCSL